VLAESVLIQTFMKNRIALHHFTNEQLLEFRSIKYYTKTERYLNSYTNKAEELGFKTDLNENAIVPDYEKLNIFEK
jgi:hypothetical protein